MEHVITTYGGGELFSLVFNGIAVLFKQDASGMVMPFIRIGLMVGLLYTLILMFMRSSFVEGIHWIFWAIIATNLLFLPKTTVFIHDPLTKERFKVDHVPLALGGFASLVSHVGKTITEKIEAVFTLPDYMPYHQTGTVFASALMSQVGKFRIVDPIFKGNMERFVNQCVVYDAMIGQKYTLADLQNTPNIWELVMRNASPVLGFLYKEGQDPGTIVTCQDGARRLNALWAAEIKRAMALYGTRVQNRTLTEAAFSTGLLGSARLLAGARGMAGTATDILKQEMMIQAIEEGANNKLSELGSASNYAATKALLQQRSTYAIAGEIAARTLPLFKNVIEALSYALFIFIVILALLPQGYRILTTYFGILLWTQLWAPLYAVLNLIMTLYGRSETSTLLGAEGLTLLNSSAILNANADMVTLAAWLSMSIPFISYGILKQGAGAFVGLAHHLGSAMQSAASGVATEIVSGNISLGNVSMGTEAYQNTTAFQQQTSPLYSGSQIKSLSASGVEQSTFGDGGQSFADQALSRLSVQIMGTENTSFGIQENLNKATSVLQSKSVAASQASETSLQNTVSFMSHIGKAFSEDTSATKNISVSDARTLQDFQNYVADVRQSNNLTSAQAVEAAIGAKIGTPEFLKVGGVSGSLSFSTQGARGETIETAQGVAAQRNYSESLDRVLAAAQAYAKSHHDTQGVDLGRNAISSLTRASSLRDEASQAQTQVTSLSKDLSASQSQSFLVNKDLTQDILEFIAHQPVNRGPVGGSSGSIGYEGARKILEMGGEDRTAYLKRFQEENPQYALSGINSGREEVALASHYEIEAQNLRARSSVNPQNESQMGEVHMKAREAGLDPQKPVSQNIVPTQEFVSALENVETRLTQRQSTLSQKTKDFQRDAQASQEKNLTLNVLGKGVSFLNPLSEPAKESIPQHITRKTGATAPDEQAQNPPPLPTKEINQTQPKKGNT